MHTPYTADFIGAFLVAQSGAALLLTALLLFWRMPIATRVLLLVATWTAALAVVVQPTLLSIGGHPGPDVLRNVLTCSASLASLAAILALRPGVSVTAVAGQIPLWLLSGYVEGSDPELSALHLAWIGLIIGLIVRDYGRRATDAPAPQPPERSYAVHDAVIFGAATMLAALVCVFVLHKHDGSADEWAYTYQAAVFAKGHAYATSPRCQPYLESFYVYETSGRLFSQYTPGWPLFITPFVWIRAVWLSGPVSFGLMAWGMARLGRSAARGFASGLVAPSERVVSAAGTWAGVLGMLSTTMELNGASRYSHVYVVALYAWSLEAVMCLASAGLPRKRQLLWGVVLGFAAASLLATRPADGAFVGLGLAALFFYQLVRGRVGWRGFVATTAAFAVMGAFVLIILRLQLGRWFTTGYSLNEVIHPWNKLKYSWPKSNEWRYGIPLATGAYCWWPCALPLGLAGLALLRGRSLGLVTAFALGCLPYLAYCCMLEYGRGFDWGYGPRFHSVLVLPMAVGGGVAIAPLAVAALERVTAGKTALARGGPFALAAFAIVSGWMRIVPLLWPSAYENTHQESAVRRAVEESHLTNAIVLARDGTAGVADLDLTTNYPIDLYPDQDVIIAIGRKTPDDAAQCLRRAFPGRRLYEAHGGGEVSITPAQ